MQFFLGTILSWNCVSLSEAKLLRVGFCIMPLAEEKNVRTSPQRAALLFQYFINHSVFYRSQRELSELKNKLKASDEESERKKLEADIEKLEKQVSE